jgi:hypothetical protein
MSPNTTQLVAVADSRAVGPDRFDLVRQLRNTAARQRTERAAILGM